jgi:Fe-S cluster biogenesis protein NfuA
MNDLTEKIKEIFEDDINPSLAMHGGSAEVLSIHGDSDSLTVNINFQGNCDGCGSAEDGTLIGIQEFLKESLDIPEVSVVNKQRRL